LVPLRPREPSFHIRRILRIPVLLHRLGMGPVFGQRFLLLVHRGRQTGRRRYALLIVLHYDGASGEAMAVAAREPQMNWLRNVVAAGAVEARIGRRRFEPAVRLLGEEETYLRLEEIQFKNRRIVRLLSRFAGLSYDGSQASPRQLAAVFRMAAFPPRNGSGIGPGSGPGGAIPDSIDAVRRIGPGIFPGRFSPRVQPRQGFQEASTLTSGEGFLLCQTAQPSAAIRTATATQPPTPR